LYAQLKEKGIDNSKVAIAFITSDAIA